MRGEGKCKQVRGRTLGRKWGDEKEKKDTEEGGELEEGELEAERKKRRGGERQEEEERTERRKKGKTKKERRKDKERRRHSFYGFVFLGISMDLLQGNF